MRFHVVIGAPLSILAVLVSMCSVSQPTRAQNVAAIVTSNRAPSAQSAPARGPSERNVLTDILKDQRDIWTSPLHLHKADAMWLVPSAVIAAALIASDKEVNGNVSRGSSAIDASNAVSHLGSGATLFAASGAFYLAGRWAHDDRARETGLLAFEALVDESIVVAALKTATNRERPDKTNGRQDFYDGGRAFPSGHAAASWAFATVVAEQYTDKPIVRWGAYGIATAVSIARVTATKHSPSDVFVGGAIGYLIGRHVARRSSTGGGATSFTFAPVVEPSTRTYGLAGELRF